MSLSKNEIKFVRSIQQKKFRDQEGLFIVEGVKVVQELIQQGNFKIKAIYSTHPEEFPEAPVTINKISDSELERISGFKQANKVLALVEIKEAQGINTTENNLILLLDDIKDPGNLGTIIRTADWFGITQIICSPNSVDVYNPKVIQASMGAIFRMNILYRDLIQTVDELKIASYEILGADMTGEDAFTFNYQQKSVLIMGSESHGLSEELKKASTCISIPKTGESESLNVGMAAGIIMAQYKRTIS